MDKRQRMKKRKSDAKTVLIVFVVVLLLPGAMLIFTGAWMIFHTSWTEIITPRRTVKPEAVVTSIGGALTVILAAIVLHTHRDDRRTRQGVTVREIGVLLAVIVMLEFAVAATCTVRERFTSAELGGEMNRTLQAVKLGTESAPEHEWNLLQTLLDCCGIWNHTDWTVSEKANNISSSNDTFLQYCRCRTDTTCYPTPDGSMWTARPCLKPYLKHLRKQFDIVRIVNAAAIVIQIACFLVFVCEGFRLHQERKVGVYVVDPVDSRVSGERTEEQTVV